jgi:hypothetical protein
MNNSGSYSDTIRLSRPQMATLLYFFAHFQTPHQLFDPFQTIPAPGTYQYIPVDLSKTVILA